MENNEENSKRHKIYSSSYFINPQKVLLLGVLGYNTLRLHHISVNWMIALLFIVLVSERYTYDISEIKSKFKKIEQLNFKQLSSFITYSGSRKEDLIIREVDWLLEMVSNLFSILLFYFLIMYAQGALWTYFFLAAYVFGLAYLMNKSKYVRYYKLG